MRVTFLKKLDRIVDISNVGYIIFDANVEEQKVILPFRLLPSTITIPARMLIQYDVFIVYVVADDDCIIYNGDKYEQLRFTFVKNISSIIPFVQRNFCNTHEHDHGLMFSITVQNVILAEIICMFYNYDDGKQHFENNRFISIVGYIYGDGEDIDIKVALRGSTQEIFNTNDTNQIDNKMSLLPRFEKIIFSCTDKIELYTYIRMHPVDSDGNNEEFAYDYLFRPVVQSISKNIGKIKMRIVG